MTKNRMVALVYGWVSILVLMLVASMILALLLRFTSFNEHTMNWLTLMLGLIVLFVGGIVSGAKGKENGWVLGGLTGIGFTLFILLFQYLGYQTSFSPDQWLYQLGFIVAALLGGMIGVNTGSSTAK